MRLLRTLMKRLGGGIRSRRLKAAIGVAARHGRARGFSSMAGGG
jgi:hypothetical protein